MLTHDVTREMVENRRGFMVTEWTVRISDETGKEFMTFKTGNEAEAREMGPRLIEFLGY